MKRFLNITVAVLFFVGAGLVHSQQINAPLADGEGQVQDLNFGANTMVINGYLYQVTDATKVEIDGSYGAFTMLKKGMIVEFSFLRFDDGVRRITELFEVDEVEEY
ncbi:MAG: hypothetical protein GKR90_12295 [Pseudomonadales bacterium]|nr:hypothetical protein [Pseudomonadales bacterium]